MLDLEVLIRKEVQEQVDKAVKEAFYAQRAMEAQPQAQPKLPERHNKPWGDGERARLMFFLDDFLHERCKKHKRTPLAIKWEVFRILKRELFPGKRLR